MSSVPNDTSLETINETSQELTIETINETVNEKSHETTSEMSHETTSEISHEACSETQKTCSSMQKNCQNLSETIMENCYNTDCDDSRAMVYCACSRCGWGLFGHFYSALSFLFSPSLRGGGADIH